MPKSTLTWYKSKANRIMKDLKRVRNKEIAEALNEPHTTITYRMQNLYQGQLEDWLRLLDLAGYEIKRIEDEK